jgi:very-short-patch-repair endonuclease
MKSKPRFHAYRPDLKLRARELRRNMTAAEAKLWYEFLRAAPLRFTRQKPLDRFIADFYCAGRQLAIEIDGDSHFDPQAERRDVSRTAALHAEGIRVLRFTNLEVMKDFGGVCERILQELQKIPPRA